MNNTLTQTKNNHKVNIKIHRGRPKKTVNIPLKGKFTVDSLAKQSKVSTVSAAKKIKEGLMTGKVKLVEKKIVAGNYKGQPKRFYVYDKNGRKPKIKKIIEKAIERVVALAQTIQEIKHKQTEVQTTQQVVVEQ